MSTVVNDPVNPAHYKRGRIEVIEFIEDQGLAFLLGNVVKYVARAGHKGEELTDLKKARWYLDRRIEQIEARGNDPVFFAEPCPAFYADPASPLACAVCGRGEDAHGR